MTEISILPAPDITWVGANPFAEGFCFGSESGQIILTDVHGHPITANRVSASGEAISGVAFSQSWLAVTTRKDINFVGPFGPVSLPREMLTFPVGGQDVTVAPISGHFVIPLGHDGVMFVKPGTSENDPVTISKAENNGLNFCRAIALPGDGGNDVVVCAGRRGGLAYADYREGIRGHTLHTVTFQDLDLVDVCTLSTPSSPLAIAAAARDGSMILFDGILTDKAPKILKFKSIGGTVYRILSAGGDIYLQTSKGLFCLFGLGSRFLRGELELHSKTDILRLPLEAADANIVHQKWLVAVGADCVFQLDIEKISKSPENAATREEPAQLATQPCWQESTFEQSYEHLAAAAA